MKIEWKTVVRLLLSLFGRRRKEPERPKSGNQKTEKPEPCSDEPANPEPASNEPEESESEIPEPEVTDDSTSPPVTSDPTSQDKISCPMATRRAIVEGVAQIRKFAEDHQLASSVVRALLTLLAELALSSLQGKVNTHVLDVMVRALRYEQ